MHKFTDNKLEILFGWIVKLDCKVLKWLCKLSNTKPCMGGQMWFYQYDADMPKAAFLSHCKG